MSGDDAGEHGGDPLPPSGEHGFAALIDRAKADLASYVQAEKDYVSAEISARIELAAQPAIAFGAAGLLGFLAAIALTVAIGLGLGSLIGPALGFFVVTLLYAVGAYLLYLRGRKRLRRMMRLQVSQRDARPEADWAPPNE